MEVAQALVVQVALAVAVVAMVQVQQAVQAQVGKALVVALV
jgi:hypothetical protein